MLLIDLERYEEIRRDPRRFIHAAGHPTSAGTVVDRGDGFEIVVKDE
jgi:hypothetical protein